MAAAWFAPRLWARRGKSGLHKVTVPGNTRAEQSDGKRHREETALACKGKGETVG